MASIEPTLYADGALRLTDHGPQGGGVVLMNVPTGKQHDFPYKDANAGLALMQLLDRRLQAMDRCRYEPAVIFERLTFATRGY